MFVLASSWNKMFKCCFILLFIFQLMCILFQSTYVFMVLVLVNYNKTAVMHSVFECSLRRMQPLNWDAVHVRLFQYNNTACMKADGLLCSGTCLLPQTPFSLSRQPPLGGAHIRCVTWTYISSAGNKLLVLYVISYGNYSTSELIGILL